MATKSFLKDVEFKDKKLANELVNALDAYTSTSREKDLFDTETSREVVELTEDKIKAFFDMN